MRFARSAERVLAAAENEARALGHGYIDVGHLLLGLVADGAGPAAELLPRVGATRNAVLKFLDANDIPYRRTADGVAPGGE